MSLGVNAYLDSVLRRGGQQALANTIRDIFSQARSPVDIGPDKSFGKIVRYDYKSVKGDSILQFFHGTHAADQTNLPSNWEPSQNEHQVVTQLKLMDADDVSAVAGAVPFTPGVDNPELLNSKLTIVNNGVTEIDEVPVVEFVSAGDQIEAGVIDLPFPIVWKGQTQLKVTITCPTAPTGTNEVFLTVLACGYGTLS